MIICLYKLKKFDKLTENMQKMIFKQFDVYSKSDYRSLSLIIKRSLELKFNIKANFSALNLTLK